MLLRIRLNEPAAAGVAWVRGLLERHDTGALEWVRIDHGSARYRGVYGCCWLPTRERPTYRISCKLPGPFPTSTTTRKPPLYRDADGAFPPLPKGCRKGAWLYDPKTGREWVQVRGRTRLGSLDQALVWIFSHEAFHYLRATRQVPGRNTEIAADAYADAQLAAFREQGRARRGTGDCAAPSGPLQRILSFLG